MKIPRLSRSYLKGPSMITVVDELPHYKNHVAEKKRKIAIEILSRPGMMEHLEKIMGRKLPRFS